MSAIFIIPTITLLIALWKINLDTRLFGKMKKKVKNFGIVHFTDTEVAKSIVSSSNFIGTHHSYDSANKRFTYFFINDKIPKDILNRNKVADKNCKIIIKDLTKEQIKSFRVRNCDNVLSYRGDFEIVASNTVSVVSAGNENNNLISNCYRKRSLYNSLLFILSILICATYIILKCILK